MAGVSKQEILNGVHAEALHEFDKIQSAYRNERLQCLQDRRFYSIAGAQWEGPLGTQFENKPKIEVNKIHLAVIRIFNEYRKNKISPLFIPKDGSKNDDLADACMGLYRADEQDSAAEEAYDNAFEEAVGGGIGAWRLRADYEDDEDDKDERQRIKIEPIYDADSSVFFDLDAKRQDKADAKSCYVMSSMSRQAYKNEYNDDPATWPKVVHQYEFDWLTPDIVFIAEYYKVEQKTETILIYRGLDGQEQRINQKDLDDDKEELLQATGFKLSRQKKVKRKRVHKYILNGNQVLEDCGFIAGKNIPIVMVYGKRWFIDNVERCQGHVRLSKDVQRLKNMQMSKLAEIAATSSVEKPIFTPEQMAGHALLWAEDNIKNNPYLLINAIEDLEGNPAAIGPQAYTRSPQLPPASAALLQITDQDIKELLGNQEAGEQLQANTPGIAIELIQDKLDMQTFIYISNMSKAVKRSAEIWLSMAKDILVEEGRKMKVISISGEPESIELLRPVVNQETGESVLENDLNEADFDVSVEVGPTSASKRAAIARSATNMLALTDDSETKQVLTSLAISNMEGEGMSEIRQFFRKKLVRIGALKPTDDEQQELAQEAANTPPDPQAEFLQASAAQAAAQGQKAQADTLLAAAKAEQTKAETVKTLAELDQGATTHLMDVMERLNNRGGLESAS